MRNQDTQQTVSFTDRATTALSTVTNPLESTFMLADTSDTTEGFFERPQVIFSEEWTPGVTFHHTIDPWSLFFENPRVVEKLRNFYLLRAQLNVKIVVNSSPFYYGRLMASYQPLAFIDSYTFFRPGTQQDFIQASQRPSVVINPAADEVAEMSLPYIYPRSALVIPEQEWKNMGTVTIADLNILQNANNVADPITVTVFAWASNVHYAQPTSDPIPVQGEYEDTHPSGVVSKPATSAARYAATLGSAPIIGTYAKATAMALNAIGAMASLFGYSRPRVTNPRTFIVNDLVRNWTNVNTADYCETLALDQKQEVTIDPRVVGCDGTDQMAIVPLAMRESYLTTFSWDTSMPAQQLLFNCPVTPLLYGVNGDQAFFTPMGWVSLPFRYWRGSLRFRFEVVASKFHRGRLRVLYDPAYQATNEYNVNYTKIIDIADGADFTMQVGWGQGVPYLPLPLLQLSSPMFSTNQITSRVAGANGVISMMVVNSLTTPNDAVANVTVNVYVSACEDFEVHAPNAGNLTGLIVNQNAVNPLPTTVLPPNPTIDPPSGFGNTLGSYVHYVQPNSDGLAPVDYGYTAVLLGSSGGSPNFSGETTLSFNGTLAPQTTPYDMTLELVAPAAAPASVIVTLGGTPFTATFRPPIGGYKSVLVTLTIQPNSVNTNILIESTDGNPWTFPLAVRNVRARFSFASTALRMQDVQTVPALGAPTNTTVGDYNYWELPPSSSIICAPPAGIFNAMMVTTDGGSTISASAGTETITISAPDGIVPRQIWGGNTALPVTSSLILTNTGANNLRIYSLGMKAIPTQGELLDETQVVAGDSTEKPVLADIFMGESVVSLRQIFKRYTISHFTPPITGNTRWQKAFPNLPVSFAKTQLAQIEMSLWKWFIPAFVGWKGSVRVRYGGHNMPHTITVSRLPLGADDYTSTTKPINDTQVNNINWNGSSMGSSAGSPLAVELPWYSNKRFLPARAAAGNSYFEPEMAYQVDIAAQSTSANSAFFAHAIGEDFSTYMFLCVPLVSPSP